MNKAKFESYKKGSIKVLIDYLTFMMVYIMFFLTFARLIKIYSLAVFTLLFVVLYSDMEAFGERDRIMKKNNTAHPLKGFVMGFFGILPIIVVVLIFFITGDPHKERSKELMLNAIMSPLYNFFKLGNETLPAYILSALIIPLIAGIGYYAGYKDFIIENIIRKALKLKPRVSRRKLR